ncbi:uncharacterized protein LOC143529171 [Bidens hawaiensis]|uniref:uncharacterized protein LOC143529171 n=1 Tax=Bidens hawaiensis TaxID=980011 RepID=UPI004049C3B6
MKQGSYFRNNNSKPYNKPNGQKINAIKEEEDDEDCPRISDYCFSVDMGGVMLAVRNLGDKARWPRKNEKAPPPKDKSKWCVFHEDFSHITEDCIALRKEISYLLSKGYLKELFERKKSRNQDPNQVPKKAAPPPPDAQVINMIFGGYDICGTSYSAAKKILIGEGSSVNIIQLEVHRRMNIPESEIVPRSSVLVGFSGETKNTLGDIKLPMPWIHEMKAVPSTYHQCVKIPTPWGIAKIGSNQQDAKDCYTFFNEAYKKVERIIAITESEKKCHGD